VCKQNASDDAVVDVFGVLKKIEEVVVVVEDVFVAVGTAVTVKFVQLYRALNLYVNSNAHARTHIPTPLSTRPPVDPTPSLPSHPSAYLPIKEHVLSLALTHFAHLNCSLGSTLCGGGTRLVCTLPLQALLAASRPNVVVVLVALGVVVVVVVAVLFPILVRGKIVIVIVVVELVVTAHAGWRLALADDALLAGAPVAIALRSGICVVFVVATRVAAEVIMSGGVCVCAGGGQVFCSEH
jgi:hypothetical protein